MSGMTKAEKQEKQEAIEKLRAMLKPGDTVRTILRHVSRSGMSREVSPVFDGEDIGWLVSRAIGSPIGPHGGVKMGGCGTDMGFALVYELSYALWPEGFGCIGDSEGRRCQSNDHANGDRDYTPHNAALIVELRAAGVESDAGKHWHREGGYALRSRWL